MSFFGLGDITFNKQQSQSFGPLSALEKTDYQYNTFRYPLDVGNYDKGHYMVIYIRTQKTTKYTSNIVGDDDISKLFGSDDATVRIREEKNKPQDKVSSVISNKASNTAKGAVKEFGESLKTLVAKPFVYNSTTNVIDNSIKNITDKSAFGSLNTTALTTDAVALYMPDTLLFSHNQEYNNLDPGKEVAGQLFAAAPGLIEAYEAAGGGPAGFSKAAIAALKSGAARAFLQNSFNSSTSQLALLGLSGGKVLNPMLELIYSSPTFRTFQYDFYFYPRSEKEAFEVQKIIERLRFHQAPELGLTESGQLDGLLTPPSEFEIKFYYGGSQNPNIPSIGTCVLTNIDLNYAPNGFNAYEVPGENKPTLGKTGMPVAIQMTLQFKETTYLTKEDFRQDLPTLSY
jgi:hypothetical protein